LSGAKSGIGWPATPAVADRSDSSALPHEFSPLGKRIFDFLFAACALLALSPILLLCAAAIRAESSGPVLFRQRRLGKGGKDFFIVKFRTMIPNAEAVLNRVLENDPKAREEWEKDRKLRNDPRITRLGRFLRRTSLDELPQFWNVLTGEMSVVGPRPIVKSEIAFYQQAYKSYCAVRPGITGLWQVSGRNDTGYGQRVALDCEYVASLSALLDLSIVFKTIKTVVGGAGAY
jgi:lipopolysaccharide/colanic/teichoic acid biosynthesis glycosyltransferase